MSVMLFFDLNQDVFLGFIGFCLKLTQQYYYGNIK